MKYSSRRLDRSDRRGRFEILEPRRLLAVLGAEQNDAPYWQSVDRQTIAPSETFQAKDYAVYSLSRTQLESQLNNAPTEVEAMREGLSREFILPKPDGSLELFRIYSTPIMAPELAAQFPEITTYAGQGITDPAATIHLDLTPAGFHAQVLSPSGVYYVDPYHHLANDDLYAIYMKRDLIHRNSFQEFEDLESHSDEQNNDASSSKRNFDVKSSDSSQLGTTFNRSGTQLRTYRTAVAANGEYTSFHGGTVALAQAAIVTAINRVSGIYESELSVRLQLVPNNASLVYTDAISDPYNNNDGVAMLTQNQQTIDAVIGNANYDLGHVFSTGGGGVATLGSMGIAGQKARGVTGLGSPVGDSFWVDFVAHEIGHQFGGAHTFNGDSGNCAGGNRTAASAYEPGSGSTIQAYAGICGNDNLQTNSDPYFHSVSFDQMINHVDNVVPSVGVRTATGNSVPTVNAGSDFTIPANTPFVLTATGSDANASNVLTYNWEQRNLGPQQDVLAPDNGSSPLFRSFNPSTDPSRTFPRLTDLVNNVLVIGEKMPLTTRTLNFRATVRDNSVGGGGVNTDDAIVSVVNTGSAFAVTAPNTSLTWPGLSTQTVTWNVAGTTANGINAANVDISLSSDGGLTYPTVIAANVPNDGSHDIVVPNTITSTARIRVQGSGNIFFDISNANFNITAPISGLDFGDAPEAAYGTLLISNGARHNIGGPVLGSAIDVETDGQPNATATGDGNDEEGVRFIEALIAGSVANLEVRSGVGGGILNYFFDFDGVGGFGNVANEVFVATLTGGTQLIPIAIPATSVASTFARFRISAEGGLGPIGLAATGEIEDYAVRIFSTAPPMDFGDAPDPLYSTLLSNDGPRHIVGGTQLGTIVNSELNAAPNSTATADQGDDGVLFRVPLVPGTTAPVSVTSTLGGVLNYFLDFDGNGVFGNQTNEVFTSVLNPGTQNVDIVVPSSATLGTTRARFRISTLGGLTSLGLSQDGEVEDYQVMITVPPVIESIFESFDVDTSVGNIPAGWSRTTTSTNNWGAVATGSHTAPNHVFVNNLITVSDSRLTSPGFVLTAANRQIRFHHLYNTEATYDGGALEFSASGGAFQDILVAGGSFVQGGYNGTLDSGFGSPMGGRQAWTGNSVGYIETIVNLPASAIGQLVQLRWRFATDSTLGEIGWRVDNIRSAGPTFSFDYGDAPDPPYPTLASNQGAAHGAGASLRLGSVVDIDTDGQPTSGSNGDGADDDGVILPANLAGGTANPVSVVASSAGILNAWIDFNNNGSWTDAGEQVVKDVALVGGTNNLVLSIPNVLATTTTVARFRLSTQSALAINGSAPDGEVEDYQVIIVPGDLVAPSVSAVKLSSSAWLGAFKSFVDPSIPDPNAGGSLPDSRGVTIPTDSQANQLRPLPWTGMNQLLIRFSEDIVGTGPSGSILGPTPTEPGDIRITGVNQPNYGNVAGVSRVSGVTFNSTTDTLIVAFTSSLTVDKLLVTIPVGRIKDIAGNNLPAFSFRINVLPGDVNGDEIVANNDSTLVRLHLDRTVADGVNFDPRRDLDGDGIIANNDSTLSRLRLDHTLPANDPSRSSGQGTTKPSDGISDLGQAGTTPVRHQSIALNKRSIILPNQPTSFVPNRQTNVASQLPGSNVESKRRPKVVLDLLEQNQLASRDLLFQTLDRWFKK